MRIRLTLIHLGIILILFLANACRKSQTEPELLSDFEYYIEDKLDTWHVPGVAIGIVKHKTLIYAKGFGFRDLERKLPVTPNTIFAIGSTTKAMTGVTLCQLVDENLLDLDLPVSNYLPDFHLSDEYVSQHITPRDLLCHRSGLPRHDFMWYGADLSREEILNRLKYLEPSSGFRSQFQYQNMMYVAAGYLVEKISVKSWEDLTRERLLNPLAMQRTNFSVEVSQRDTDFASPYSFVNGEPEKISFRNIDAMGPAGSINSCINDLSHWVIMQLNGGMYNDHRIVSEEMLKETHTPQIVIPGETTDELFYSSYGLGWGITSYRGHLRISHGGSIDGFISEIALFPNDSLGIIILTNLNHTQLATLLRNKLSDRLLGLPELDWVKRLKGNSHNNSETKYVPRVVNSKPTQPLEGFVGSYQHPAYGRITISLQDNSLLLKFHGFETPLRHFHYNTFEAEEGILQKQQFCFHTTNNGNIDRVSARLQEGVKDIVFERTDGIENKYGER